MAASSRPHDESVQAAQFFTDLGWMAIAAGQAGVRSLTFGHRSARGALRALSVDVPTRPAVAQSGDPGCEDSFLADLADRLTRYAAGHPVDFGDVALDYDGLTRFQVRVVRACRTVAWGKTTTYGDLATRAGAPRAARAVGNVMAANRYPIVVPCHRVVGAGGALGGFSAPSGVAMKRRLLRLEGALPGRAT